MGPSMTTDRRARLGRDETDLLRHLLCAAGGPAVHSSAPIPGLGPVVVAAPASGGNPKQYRMSKSDGDGAVRISVPRPQRQQGGPCWRCGREGDESTQVDITPDCGDGVSGGRDGEDLLVLGAVFLLAEARLADNEVAG